MGAIFRREMSAYFTSPIAYMFLAIFNFFAGLFFTLICLLNRNTDMSSVYSNMLFMLVFLFPVLTMRLLSEERKQKTDQCLLTSPVSLTGIVLGKYFAALVVYALSLISVLLYAIILAAFSPIDWAVMIGSIIGSLFVGVAFISIGLFISSLTENQIIAVIGGFVVMMFLYLIDSISASISNTVVQTFLQKIAFTSKYNEFSSGIFNISTILYFLSTAVIFNYLTIRVLEKRRWS